MQQLTGGFTLLGMMQATRPIDSHVAQAMVQLDSSFDAGARIQPAEVEQAVKYWTVLAHVELDHLRVELFLVVWCGCGQEVDVLRGVKGCQLIWHCSPGPLQVRPVASV